MTFIHKPFINLICFALLANVSVSDVQTLTSPLPTTQTDSIETVSSDDTNILFETFDTQPTVSSSDTETESLSDNDTVSSSDVATGSLSGNDTLSSSDVTTGSLSGNDTLSSSDVTNGSLSGNDTVSSSDAGTTSSLSFVRVNGLYEQNTFFANADAYYEWNCSTASTISANDYTAPVFKVNDTPLDTAIIDNNIRVYFPDELQGELKILYNTSGLTTLPVVSDYIVSESSAPQITYEAIQSDGISKIKISICEIGSITSGINSYECYIDGAKLEASIYEEKQYYDLENGASFVYQINTEFPYDSSAEHEIKILATDNCGNHTEETFTTTTFVNDGITVVLPTNISLLMLQSRGNVENNVQSQDIMIINKSDSPIGVTVSKAVFTNKNADTLDCTLNMDIREYNKPDNRISINSVSGNDSIVYMELAPAREDTDSAALLQKAAKWNPTGAVTSPDYGILRLMGTMENGDWEDGDISVDLVFDFTQINTDSGI